MNKKKLGFSYIGNINCSSKIVKGVKYGIDTYIIYLAPYKISGHNVCAGATEECVIGCLNTSGRASRMEKSYQMFTEARIKKTQLFYSDRQLFMETMVKEIAMHKRRAERKGHVFAVRINGTSDLSPVLFKLNGKNILEIFPDVQFYDYTKIVNRIEIAEKYKNYDLTLSYTGHNWNDCEKALRRGIRVAVVFDVKRTAELPTMFNGHKVIDGDITDYRVKDEVAIVALRWKTIRDRAMNEVIRKSSFVVNLEERLLLAA